MTHKAKPIMIVVGAILIAMFPLSRWIASAYLRNAPRVYFSAVTIEIRPDSSDRAHPVGSDDSSGRIGSQFRATQIQRIQTVEILTPVIERLDLVKKLSPPGMTMPLKWVTDVLSQSIVVREQRNTTLTEIGVYHTDKQLAADIANTIAITYRDKRIEDLRKIIQQTLAEMKGELKTKREEMDRLFLEGSRIRLEDNIVDSDPESANATLSFGAERSLGGRDSTGMNRYVEKKAAYLVAKQLLLNLQKQYDAARFVCYLSQPPVKIWQQAEPAQTPVLPDAVAILRLANAIGGSLGAIGVLLIVIGVRIPSRMASRAEAQE